MNGKDELFEQFGKLYHKGTKIFNDGDLGNNVFIIQSGKVRIYKIIDGTDKTLSILGPGDFLGEMAVLEKKPRSASAEAMEDSKVLILDPQTFEELIKTNGEIGLRIIKKLIQRLRTADSLIECIFINDPLQRIVSLLASFGEGAVVAQNKCDIGMGIGEIAKLAGMNAPSVEAVMEKLQSLKIISFQNKNIHIADYNGLLNYKEILGIKN
ncbi:MAG TPA: Crp/Fnr family transcriptional regulator [bacterium]